MQTILLTELSGDIQVQSPPRTLVLTRPALQGRGIFFILFFIITKYCCRSWFLKNTFRKTLFEISEVLYWGSFQERADVLSNIQGKAEGGRRRRGKLFFGKAAISFQSFVITSFDKRK